MPNYGHLSLSCAKIERPSPLEKPSCKVRFFAQNHSRKYRQKITATTPSQTAFHRVFQLFSQTAHVRSHSRKWVHTRLSEKDRTQRLTRRNRALSSPGHSTVLSSQRNRHRKNSRRKRMCAFTACVRFLRRRGPAGLRNLFFDYSVVIFAPLLV